MKIVAFVPIKLNNERLPNKNIKKFTNGLPLMSYVLNTLTSLSQLDDVYVFCSNDAIRNYTPTGVKILERSSSLDTSQTKINEIIASFIKKVDADIYVLSHATSPFITSCSIERGLNKVVSGEYDSSFTVKKIQEFLWKDYKPFNYSLSSIPRTQDLEEMYAETSGFYIFTKKVFEEGYKRIGNNPFLVEVNQIEAIDIDEEEDFNIANAIYNFYGNLR